MVMVLKAECLRASAPEDHAGSTTNEQLTLTIVPHLNVEVGATVPQDLPLYSNSRLGDGYVLDITLA